MAAWQRLGVRPVVNVRTVCPKGEGFGSLAWGLRFRVYRV